MLNSEIISIEQTILDVIGKPTPEAVESIGQEMRDRIERGDTLGDVLSWVKSNIEGEKL